jgi:hypothetical protein
VTSILLFGHALDAMVAAGIIGNAIVFVLTRATSFNAFRTAPGCECKQANVCINSVPDSPYSRTRIAVSITGD